MRKSTPGPALLPIDPSESARLIGLRYVHHQGDGIVRRRAGSGFIYVDPAGKIVRDREVMKRIRSLVIPPAWTNVWICPIASGHLQAVGRDAKGRKQYRYHPLYRQIREQTKFGRMALFGRLLPVIRKRVKRDLGLPGWPKEKIIATIVRLLETSCIRIGNDDYAKANGSYGLTTLRNKHVQVEGAKIRFHFLGKSKQVHDIELNDPRLARILYQCQCIPGQELFQYIGADGEHSKISSEDVNEYLRETTGEYFTAKDFRTWVGTVEAFRLFRQAGRAPSEKAAKENYVDVVKHVAAKLGNRPATAKKSYIHPAIYDSYLDRSLFEAAHAAKGNAARADELRVISLIAHKQARKAA